MAIKKTLLSLVVLAFAFAMVGPAQAIGPERTQEWMAAQEGVEPGFAPGDTITFENADVLRPFVPPSYQDIMIFDGMEVKIGETRDLTPSDVYMQATMQHQAQVVLAEDGALENFVAGRPFDTSKFVPESTQGENMDGYRAIWKL